MSDIFDGDTLLLFQQNQQKCAVPHRQFFTYLNPRWCSSPQNPIQIPVDNLLLKAERPKHSISSFYTAIHSNIESSSSALIRVWERKLGRGPEIENWTNTRDAI